MDRLSSGQGQQRSGTDQTMAAGGRLTHLARTRGRYSGEPFQYASEALRTHRHAPLLPDARGEQAVLEAQVMKELGRGGEWWAHPMGISGVRLEAGCTVVLLDSHSGSRPGRAFPMSEYSLTHLLPCAEPGVQVGGVMCLRVAKIHHADLHLRLVCTDTRLVLRGVPGTHWSELLEQRWRNLERSGFVPLWLDAAPSPYELEDERQFASLVQDERDLAWLGSGLLRRIAMFQSFSTAYSTRSWINADEWIFELDTHRDVPLAHDAFLASLTENNWGIPMRIARRYCNCGVSGRGGYQCTFYLEHRHPDVPGTMQIRFRWGDAGDVAHVRGRWEQLQADADWLDRVLPRRTGWTDRPLVRQGGFQ